MKRKIIQLAGKTMVVSLPSKWVKRYNVRKGEEIEVEERGRELLLKTSAEPEARKIEFDTRGQSERVIRLAISGFHKKGYDEIELIYDNKKTIDLIQDLIKDFFIGFVIINQTNNRCVIKSIAHDSEMEFDNSLRRAFLVTITMGDNILEAFKKKDYSSLNSVLSLEKTNNQLTGFCERILNRTSHSDPRDACFYYVITWNLEKVCDEYKYLCERILESSRKSFSLDGEIVSFYEKTLNYLKDYYELFYKFDNKRVSDFVDKGKELTKEGQSLINKNVGGKNIVCTLINQVTRVSDFLSSTIPINIDT